jgi:hypothetical protein
MATLERKFQEKTFVWKIFEDGFGMKKGLQESRYPISLFTVRVKLGKKQGVQESMYPISLTHGYTQIGDEVRSTRVRVPKFSHSWLHSNWEWNREYKSQGTQFLSLMATVKLGMKQVLQESRYPISLTHGYTQIGDETGSIRVKVPGFFHSWLHSNWGWNRGYKSEGTQFLSFMPTVKLGMKQGVQESRYPILQPKDTLM